MEQPKPVPQSNDLDCLLERLKQARARSLEAARRLSASHLDTQTRIRSRTLRQLFHVWVDHYRGHAVQLYNLRLDLDDRPDEVARLVGQGHATFGEVLGQLTAVKPEIVARAPKEGEWTILEVVQHLVEFEERYAAEFTRIAESPAESK